MPCCCEVRAGVRPLLLRGGLAAVVDSFDAGFDVSLGHGVRAPIDRHVGPEFLFLRFDRPPSLRDLGL